MSYKLSIFHGDNLGASRLALNSLLDSYKAQNYEVQFVKGAAVTAPELDTHLSSESLFYKQVLVIEGLLTRPLSKLKNTCLKALQDYHGNKPIVIWEPKEASRAMLNKLPGAKVMLSKTPAPVFRLLETLTPTSRRVSLALLHEAAAYAEEGFIFIMFARHISDLLVAKSGDTSKLLPWKKSKIIAQATLWSEPELLALHQALVKIDFSLKSGRTKLSYLASLDILLTTLLR